MNLSKEEALRLHREMWSAMQKAFGDCPTYRERIVFKRQWCESHGYNMRHNCFLCEYDCQFDDSDCINCPIKWPYGTCIAGDYCYFAPISEILALEES